MSQNQNNQRKKGWVHYPLVHVLLFLIIIGIGAVIGVMSEKPIWGLMVGLVLGVGAGTIAGTILENKEQFLLRYNRQKDAAGVKHQ